MPNHHNAPSYNAETSFKEVATPMTAFISEPISDISGHEADPNGTIEDSVDITDHSYNEAKSRDLEEQLASKDHSEPPTFINTLDA